MTSISQSGLRGGRSLCEYCTNFLLRRAELTANLISTYCIGKLLDILLDILRDRERREQEKKIHYSKRIQTFLQEFFPFVDLNFQKIFSYNSVHPIKVTNVATVQISGPFFPMCCFSDHLKTCY